jgi:hypothetical protein
VLEPPIGQRVRTSPWKEIQRLEDVGARMKMEMIAQAVTALSIACSEYKQRRNSSLKLYFFSDYWDKGVQQNNELPNHG